MGTALIAHPHQPHPLWSWLSAGQARPGTDLLGMLLAAGVPPATPPPPTPTPSKHMGAAHRQRREKMETFGGDESLFLR